MNLEQVIRERLGALEPQRLDIVDESALHAGHAGARSGGRHYRMTVVAASFDGRNKVARHRMVYQALGPLMQRDIHALALETLTPDEQAERSEGAV